MNKKSGFSLLELTAVMAITSILAGSAAIVFDAHLKNSEEFSHLESARKMAVAAETTIIDKNQNPDTGESTITYTLAQLYEADRMKSLKDPSSESDSLYNSTDSKIIAAIVDATDGSSRKVFEYYVTLVNASSNYTYIKQLDTDTSPVNVPDLSNDHVKIPKRDASGF